MSITRRPRIWIHKQGRWQIAYSWMIPNSQNVAGLHRCSPPLAFLWCFPPGHQSLVVLAFLARETPTMVHGRLAFLAGNALLPRRTTKVGPFSREMPHPRSMGMAFLLPLGASPAFLRHFSPTSPPFLSLFFSSPSPAFLLSISFGWFLRGNDLSPGEMPFAWRHIGNSLRNPFPIRNGVSH